MPHQIHVAAKALKAAVVLAAKKDIRPYLCGVLVQAWSNETRIVATDGVALGVIRDERDNEVPAGAAPVEFIVPRETIDDLKLGKRELDSLALRIDVPDDRDSDFLLHAGRISTSFRRVDGRFPDYARAIPGEVSGVVSQFDPDVVSRMGKCLGILNGLTKGVVDMRIEHNGAVVRDEATNAKRRADGTAVVYGKHNNFVGVIAPLRSYPDCMGTDWTKRAPDMPATAVNEFA